MEVAESSIQSPVNRLTRDASSVSNVINPSISNRIFISARNYKFTIYIRVFIIKKSEFQINVLFKLKFKANVAVFVGAIHTAVYLMTEGADS